MKNLKEYKGYILKIISKTKKEKESLDNKDRHAYDYYESHINNGAIIKISDEGYIETIENGQLINVSGEWAGYAPWKIFEKPNLLKNHRPCKETQNSK